MKYLSNIILASAIFITSFMEIAIVKSQRSSDKIFSLRINQTYAEYSCPEDVTTQQCSSLKSMYNDCEGEHDECQRFADDQAAYLPEATPEDTFDDTYGLLEADHITSLSFWSLNIKLIAEIVSAGIRMSILGAQSAVSALIHLLSSSLLLLAFVTMGFIFRSQLLDLMEGNSYVSGESYVDRKRELLK